MSGCFLNNTTEMVSDWLRHGPLLGNGLVNIGIKDGTNYPSTMEIRLLPVNKNRNNACRD
jgi:hypothetical protein